MTHGDPNNADNKHAMYLTNTHLIETVDIVGSKTWADDGNRDGICPQSITIRLYADGTQVDSKVVEPYANGNWAWTFDNLLKHKNVGGEAVEIRYSITEGTVADYTASVTGYDVTNTYTPETITITGSKTWDDNNNQDGKRPAHIFVRLYANGQPTSYMEHVHDEAGKWTWKFVGLPKYEGGVPITYSIREYAEQYDENNPGASVQNPVPGYTTAYQTGADGSLNITNTRVPETVDIQGVKHWRDQNNQAGVRPESITINLLANGTQVDSKVVEPDANGNWAWTFKDMPRYANGRATGMQPVGPDKDGWYTFEDLPVMVGGAKAVYTVTEAPVAGYDAAYVNENGELNAAYPGGTIINTMISTILGKLPETGDRSSLMRYAALLLSMTGLALMRRRRVGN